MKGAGKSRDAIEGKAMDILAIRADEKVKNVHFTEETISVDLMDDRTILRNRRSPSGQVGYH